MVFEISSSILDTKADCVTTPSGGNLGQNQLRLVEEFFSQINQNQIADRTNPCNIVRVGFMATQSIDCDGNEVGTKVIEQMNTILRNSLVPAAILRFEKAGFEYLPSSFVETGTIGTDNVTFGTSAAALNFRAQNEVDVLVVLTDGGYSTAFGVAPGGTAGNPTAISSFCLVEAYAAVPNKTAAHEVGHVMGADHACLNMPAILCAGDGSTIMHGLTFGTKPGKTCCRFERFTNMGIGEKPHKRRILNYSNPAVTFSGVSTGNIDADVSTWLSGTACVVAEFFPSPTTLTALIDAPAEVHIQYFSVTADVLGGTMPYTYEWAYSADGTNYTALSSTASSVSIPKVW